jgi:hypothetical protein
MVKVLVNSTQIPATRRQVPDSHIVHAGKKRLDLNEWQLFSQLRWICQRVIQEESRLLAEGLKQ